MNKQENKSYIKGFQEAVVESYIYDNKKRHFLRRYFYGLGKKVQDFFRTYNKKNPDYVAGYHDGSKSEWGKNR